MNTLCLGGGHEPVTLRDDSDGTVDIDYALLLDTATGAGYPVLAGFPLFTEPLADAAARLPDRDSLLRLERELMGDPAEYARFVADKWRRPNRDAYAAFQPFNESTRALYPLIPLLREQLEPGDLILDTWCRTGWSGELLAALFPAQTVVSVWEGNQGVLGYRAFRHWLSTGSRAQNLEILFHDMNAPLPFASGSFAAVIGLDTLHRYDADNLLVECQRITRDEAPILFPHVHLTNSEPDPWFERGCRQEHGEFWQAYLERMSCTPSRRVYIDSEMDLFTSEGNRPIRSNPATPHYNAFVGLVPSGWQGRTLAGIRGHFDGTIDGASYVVTNPLVNFDLHSLHVDIGDRDDDGMIEHMLSRHPGYGRFLAARMPLALTPDQARVVYWAMKALSIAEIAERLSLTATEVLASLEPLVAADVALVLPVSRGMAQLNRYFAAQEATQPDAQQNLAAFWRRTVRDNADTRYVRVTGDELDLSYAELHQLAEVTAGRLMAELEDPSAPVVVCARPAVESVLLFWAAQLTGRPFVAIDPSWSVSRIAAVLEAHGFVLVFSDLPLSGAHAAGSHITVIAFESADPVPGDTVSGDRAFEDWLEQGALSPLPGREPSPDDTSVVLFTSGTTGLPKGVRLSHRAVLQSAVTFARHYDWRPDDVYLGLGHYATMSGLRNPLVATAVVGASFLVPDAAACSSVLRAVSLVGTEQVTVMGVVPAFLSRLAALASRLEPLSFKNLGYFLSTATDLRDSVAGRIEETLGVPVYNYYGLTESCGACIFMPKERRARARAIGRPVDTIAQIVTADDQLVTGQTPGELRLYNGNLMQGYLGQPGSEAGMVKNGWLYTGDICRWSQDGLIELLGRERDIVKTPSGVLVCLAEVEQCLQDFSGIDDLAVAGTADGGGDERLLCFIHAPGAQHPDEIRARFNERLLASLGAEYQLSEVVLVDALPRGANDKVLRQELARLRPRSDGESRL